MPSKSQKGLPPNGDGAAPTEDSRLATAHDDDEGKPKEYVEQDEADLEKVVQGVAMDTGAEDDKVSCIVSSTPCCGVRKADTVRSTARSASSS